MITTMKKLISKVALLATVAFGAVACTSWLEVDESQNHYVSLGTLDPVTRTIKGDYGELLNIVEVGTNTSVEEIESKSGRVCFNYSVLKRLQNSVNIRLHEFYPLVIDDIDPLSIMDEEDRAELGTTPAIPTQASITGGYVNLQIAYVDTGADGTEFEFELVYDDTENGSTDNTLVLQICHKGETVNKKPSDSGSFAYQWASFKLSEELLERYGNKSSLDLLVVFRHRWWNNAGEVVENVAHLSTSPYSEMSSL